MQVGKAVQVLGKNLHMGVSLQIVEQGGGHDLLAKQQRHGQVQMATRLGMQAAGRGFGLGNLLQDALAVTGKALAGLGQAHPTGAALQQWRAQALFQCGNRAGHGGGGDIQAARCGRQAEVADHRLENPHLMVTIHPVQFRPSGLSALDWLNCALQKSTKVRTLAGTLRAL